MGPVTAFTSFFTRYFDVYGRSRRSEYGWMIINQILAYILLMILYGIMTGGLDAINADDPTAIDYTMGGSSA